MNTWKKLPKRQKKQGRSYEKKKGAAMPALESRTCTSAAAWEKDEVSNNGSFKDGAEVAEDASRELAQDRSAEDLEEPADELEDQLMQMFCPSDEAIGGHCLGTGKESEKMLQDVNKPSQGPLEKAKDFEGAKMLTHEDGFVGIADGGLGASDNILDEDLSLCEEVEKESDANLTTSAGEEGGKETSLEEESATPVLGPCEPVLVQTGGTELVARQADAICSQFAQELITRYSAPLVSSPDQTVKTEVPNRCWEYPDKEPNEEEDSEGDDVIILEELSEEDMQLALSRRDDLGENDADVGKESLPECPSIPPPDRESDSETERFINSVEDVLAAARSRRRLGGDTEGGKDSRLEQGGSEGGEKASRKLQAVQQTAKVQRGRSETSNREERGRSKMGGGEQQGGKGEEDSPTRKRIKRFLLNEEQRDNRRNGESYYVKVQKVEERKGQKRPRERESQTLSHPDPRDSYSPMAKIPKLVHPSSRHATNGRKFSYKGNRLTFDEILKKEGVERRLKLQPLLKPLIELPVWVESETMSMREETTQEREDREKREKRIARFGSTVQLDQQEQQEWQEQEWQQLREVLLTFLKVLCSGKAMSLD